MMKIYTNEPKTSEELTKSPRKAVINSILNYSRALEVLKPEENESKKFNAVEVILN